METTKMSTDELLYEENLVYICSGIFLSHEKELLPFEATQMDLKGIMLSVIRQRKTSIVCSRLYVESQNVELIHRVDWWSPGSGTQEK